MRLRTPEDYYVVRANALEDNVRFYRVVKGKREQLAGANTKVATNTWHTLTLKAEGDRFTVSYDGKELYAANDATFAEAGKIALWTKADSITYFDNLTIRPLPEGGEKTFLLPRFGLFGGGTTKGDPKRPPPTNDFIAFLKS